MRNVAKLLRVRKIYTTVKESFISSSIFVDFHLYVIPIYIFYALREIFPFLIKYKTSKKHAFVSS